MSIRESLTALVRKRERRGCWIYLLWLAGYCALAFIATVYAALLGLDYLWAFLLFLVPAVVGYVQFRLPTVLGWVVLFIPTAFLGVVALCLFPWAVKGALVARDFGQLLGGTLLLIVPAVVLYGLIRCLRTHIAEPGAAPNGGAATSLGNPEVTEGPPSAR